MPALMILPPLLAILLGAASVVTPSRAVARLSGVATSAVLLACGVGLLALDPTVQRAGWGLLRADALSAFMLTVIGAVGLTATWGGLAPREPDDPPRATSAQRRYAALVCLFLGAMSLAVLTDYVPGNIIGLLFPSRLCDRQGVREPVAWGLAPPGRLPWGT